MQKRIILNLKKKKKKLISFRIFKPAFSLWLVFLLVFQIIAGVLLLPPIEEAGAAGWDDSDWDYRKKITFTSDSAKIPSTQTDFPALISITDADLRDNAKDDGYDIVFTKSDGTAQLNHEIEKFDGLTGELAAWVEVDSLSTSTEIYLYYGNSNQTETKENISATWDADRNGDLTPDFAMVHHMEENPAGGASPDGSDEMFDSTSNSNDGNTGGTMTIGDQVAGQIDGSVDFDGTDDYVDLSSNLNPHMLDCPALFTFHRDKSN